MAGVVSPSMWVYELRDEVHDHTSWCSLNEGLGKVLRYGAYGPEVIDRLRWMNAVLGPLLQQAVRSRGSVDVKAVIAQMLQMGDEGHNRNRAGSLMLLRELLPGLITADAPSSDVAEAVRFSGANEHFFLNLGMPACKLSTMAAEGIAGSSVVTTMARNGTDFGIRTAGTGDQWFTGPANTPEGLFLGSYGPDDANPDIGDSAITETAGIGGFAMAAAPAIVRFVGGDVPLALRATRTMYEITVGEHTAYQVPILEFRGTPTGIDVTAVVRTGILPQINTGMAGRVAGTGQVGAGLVTPPAECFTGALGGAGRASRRAEPAARARSRAGARRARPGGRGRIRARDGTHPRRQGGPATIKDELRGRVAVLREHGLVPGLGTVLVGDDPGSQWYVGAKHRDCAEVGITSIRRDLPATATQDEVEAVIDELNADPDCTGFLVQQPTGLDEFALLSRVDPGKDVDGLHPTNLGWLVLGKPAPLPCTPAGCIELLRRHDVPIAGARVAVIGRGITVGRPLGLMLTRRSENATVVLCHTGTRDLAAEVRQADIVVAAAGVPGIVTADMVKPGAAVLDVGVSRIVAEDGRSQVAGDVAADVAEVAGWVSPNPGGVGPMTRAMLLSNIVTAAEQQLPATA